MQRQQQPGYGYQQQPGYNQQQYPQGYGVPQQGYGAPIYQQQRQMRPQQPMQSTQPKEKNRTFTQATLKDLLDVVAKEQKMT